MGKTFIVRQQTTENSKKEIEYCRNCDNQILRNTKNGFCCNKCKEEYQLKWHSKSMNDKHIDTESLPYKAYQNLYGGNNDNFTSSYPG